MNQHRQLQTLRERLRQAKQTAKRGKWLETRLRAEGRVAAYRTAIRLAVSESCKSTGGE